jgi:hypothetical protein
MSRYWSSVLRNRPGEKNIARSGPLLHFPQTGGIHGPPLWRREF